MKTVLYYYTGTGNALWATRELANAISEDVEIIAIKSLITATTVDVQADAIGFVFPIHMWGVPRPIIDFVHKLTPDKSKYYFALGVNAGQVARSLVQLKEVMQSRGMTIDAGFDIVLPSNYIPWGGPGPENKQHARINAAGKKIIDIAYTVDKKYPQEIEKGPLWQNILFSIIYKLTYNIIPGMDKDFWVDNKCNHCGICEQVCPSKNIKLVNGKPTWHGNCEQCFACLQWCPTKAIQFGKKTPHYERYHHPSVTVKDMLDSGKAKKDL